MAIMDADSLLEVTRPLLVGIDAPLQVEVLESCVEHTMSELQWSFPVSGKLKEYWVVERCRRHILYAMVTLTAMKFQYKQIHLEHRFKHLSKLIEDLDAAFMKAIEDFPDLFGHLSSSYPDIAHYIQSGFTYDRLGIEL